MKVRELMTADPVTVSPTDMLSSVDEKMKRGKFRRAPVVDESGKLVAILTDGDLREHIGHLANTRVRAAMVENPVTISLNATIGAAASLMTWHKIGGLPVLDKEGGLVGIITESDLLLALADNTLSAGSPEPAGSRVAR